MADIQHNGQSLPDEELQTVDVKGNPVKNRVLNADAAYNIFDKLKKESESIDAQRAKIQGQQDGNAPYSKSERVRLGLNWMSNVNFGRARASVRLNTTSIWQMLMSVHSFIDLMMVNKDDADPEDPGADWGSIIADEFTKTLRSSDDFYYNLMTRLKEMTTHGLGAVVWPDEFDWRSESVKISNILYPNRSKAKNKGLKLVCLRDEIDPIELLDKIGDGDPDVEIDDGWNVDEVKRVLIQAYQGGGQKQDDEYSSSIWETTQQRIKSHQYELDAEFDGIRIVNMMVEEIGGGVTHLIFAETDPASKGGEKKKNLRQFMYKKEKRFESMTNVLHFMMFDTGNGDLNSVRGLAFELFHTEDIGNRTMNTVVDASGIASSIIVQPQSGEDTSKLAVTKMGPIVSVPSQLNIQQSSFRPSIGDSLQALRLMFDVENGNAGVYKSGQNDVLQQVEKTARQVDAETTNEARFESNQSAWYYVQWEAWLQETFDRMLNPAYPKDHGGWHKRQRFIDSCIARGVPERMLDSSKWYLRAVRAVGMGSPIVARRTMQWALNNMMPFTDERGRENILVDAVLANAGSDKVERWLPVRGRDRMASDAHSMAALENNDFREGSYVPAGVDQPQTIHLTVHLSDAMESIKAFQEAPDPAQAETLAVYLQRQLQHSGEHLSFLSADPTRKQKVEEFTSFMDQIAQFLQGLLSQVEKLRSEQQKVAEQNAQMLEEAKKALEGREERIEMARIESNERVEMAKAESLDRQRTAKTSTQITAMFRKLQADIQSQAIKTNADVQAQFAELNAKLAKITGE